MRELSEELRERLEGQRGEKRTPLPISYFVTVDWPLDGQAEDTARRCYSTLGISVKMDGNRYEETNRLLHFEEENEDAGFVMSRDDRRYGASCGFRVMDNEGLARNTVATANTKREFPTIWCEAWVHFSDIVDEIESLRYGLMVFGGHLTRVELHSKPDGVEMAKVWGGHEGIVTSRARPDLNESASALGRPLSWSRRVSRLIQQSVTA